MARLCAFVAAQEAQQRPRPILRSGSAVGSEDDRCFARVAGVVQRVGVAADNQGSARLRNRVVFVSARLPQAPGGAPVWVAQAATHSAKPRRLSFDPVPPGVRTAATRRLEVIRSRSEASPASASLRHVAAGASPLLM